MSGRIEVITYLTLPFLSIFGPESEVKSFSDMMKSFLYGDNCTLYVSNIQYMISLCSNSFDEVCYIFGARSVIQKLIIGTTFLTAFFELHVGYAVFLTDTLPS